MKIQRRRRLSRVIVLGLAAAAFGPQSASATVMPYLSQGQLQDVTPSAESQYAVYGGWTEHVAQDNSANGTSIGLAGKFRNSGRGAIAGGQASGAFGNPAGTAPGTAASS